MSLNAEKRKEIEARLRKQIEKYRAWEQARGRGEIAPPHTELKLRVGVPFLEAALQRIEDGTYGTCINCGEDISAERLEAVIGASRCARCQQESENSRRNRGLLR